MSWRRLVGGRRGELLLLGLIVAVAAWLRLGSLDLCEYKSDEAVAIDLTLPLVEGRGLPLIGLRSSVGINNPPLMMYLLAPPLLLKVDPLLATGFVGLLGTLAVALCYFVLRSRFGPFAALTACALFATAPWAVLYARKIWAQDFLPIFSVLLLHALLAVLERPKTWWALALPVLACALWQLHFSAFALFGVIGLVVLYRARRVRWTALAIGIVIAVGMLTPYLVHQVRHHWDDFARIKGFVTGSGKRGGSSQRPRDLRAVSYTARIVGASGWSYVTGSSQRAFERRSGAGRWAGQAASTLATILLGLGFVVMLLRIVRRVRWVRSFPFVELDLAEEQRGLVVLWLGGVWAFFIMARLQGVYPHYLIITYPVPFVVIAIALSDLRGLFSQRWRRVAHWALAVVVGLLALGYVGFDVSFNGFVAEHGGTAGDYGVAYRHKDALVEFARRHRLGIRGGGYEVQRLLGIRRRLKYPVAPSSATAPPGRWLQVGNSLRGRAPRCAPARMRRFGPLVACVRP